MPRLSRGFTLRREMEEHTFHPLVIMLVPLAAVGLGAYLPKLFPQLAILDLPLIVVIFFAVSRRNPMSGTFVGTVVGLLQDLLLNQPIGINGMMKAVIGYGAASVGLRIDVDALPTRVLLNFGFTLLQSVMLYLIQRLLLGNNNMTVLWLHELVRAVVNTVVAVPIFLALDRAKIRD